MGGTATYSPRSARALGSSVAVVTSAEPDYDLEEALAGIPVALLPAAATTTFENIYTPGGRRQILHSVAGLLVPAAVPQEWRTPRIAHLGPVSNEIDPQVIDLLEGSMIGLTPQGWHRRWGPDGQVRFAHWPAAAEVLPRASAVIVSQEDIQDEETWAIYRRYCRILVTTNGAAGCEVLFGGEERSFRVAEVAEVDPTGVGDIFAAAFLIRLWETDGDPWEAARFATQIAAPTVARPALEGIPTAAEVAAARAACKRGLP